MLEHSLCKTEYELAKLQNIMNDDEGVLPNCNRLPIAGSKESNDCIHLELPNMLTSTIIGIDLLIYCNRFFLFAK